MPKLTKLYCNGFLLCSGPGETSFPVTNIKLEHKIKTGLQLTGSNQQISRPQVQPQIPVYSTWRPQVVDKTSKRPETEPPTIRTTTYRPITEPPTIKSTTYRPTEPAVVNQYMKDHDVCGQPIIQGVGLIIGGRGTTRGQWPWLVAYYESIGAGKYKFSCGGSLVSSKI